MRTGSKFVSLAASLLTAAFLASPRDPDVVAGVDWARPERRRTTDLKQRRRRAKTARQKARKAARQRAKGGR